MTAFVLFANNTDVSMNRLIAQKTGELDSYNSAMEFFKEKRVRKHGYVIIRKDTPDRPTVASCYTNLFGEIPGLGGVPYIFNLD